MESIKKSNLNNKLMTKMKIYNADYGKFAVVAVYLLEKFIKVNIFPKSFSLYDLADFFSEYDLPDLEKDICSCSLMDYPLKKEDIDEEKIAYWNWTCVFIDIDRYNNQNCSYICGLKVLEIKQNSDSFKIGERADHLIYIKMAIDRKKVFSLSKKGHFREIDVADPSTFYYIDCEIKENGHIHIKSHTSIEKVLLYNKWYDYRKNKFYTIKLKERKIDIVLTYEVFIKFIENVTEFVNHDPKMIEILLF